MSSGNIPETLVNLTNLRELCLYDNHLSGTYQYYTLNKKEWKLCMALGTIPMQLGKAVSFPSGLMLPENIGDDGDNITELSLTLNRLIGKCVYPDLRALSLS
jgi:hypothetical protein